MGKGASRARKSAAEADAPDSGPDVPESFEAALFQLEQVVARLEGGEVPLETALADFEEGVRLTRHCAEQLGAAERRIEILMKQGDEWVARPFGDAEDGADGEEDGWES